MCNQRIFGICCHVSSMALGKVLLVSLLLAVLPPSATFYLIGQVKTAWSCDDAGHFLVPFGQFLSIKVGQPLLLYK